MVQEKHLQWNIDAGWMVVAPSDSEQHDSSTAEQSTENTLQDHKVQFKKEHSTSSIHDSKKEEEIIRKGKQQHTMSTPRSAVQ